MGGVGFLNSLIELNNDSGQMAKPKSSINHLLTHGLKDKCQDLTSNPWGINKNCFQLLACTESFESRLQNLITSPPAQSFLPLCSHLAGSAKGLLCKQSPELTKSLSSEIPSTQSLHTGQSLPSECFFQT